MIQLHHSLFFRTAVLIGIAFLATSWFILQQQERLTEQHSQQMQQKLHAKLASSLVKEHTLFKTDGQEIDKKQLKSLFHKMMILGPNFEFYLLDPQGKILAHAQDKSILMKDSVDLAPIKTFIAQDRSLPLYGDNPKNPTEQKVFNAAPVYTDGQLSGYLYVIIGSSIYDNLSAAFKEDRGYLMICYTMTALLGFALLASSIIIVFIAKPVRKLAHDVEQCQQGASNNICTAECHNRKDEISVLRQAFHSLTEQLQEQYDALQESDNARRQMVSHISHDLRTPLTNIEGYIETLTLQPQLSQDDQQELLAITAKHAGKLKRLIEQLFELAQLDTQFDIIQCEPFNMGELICDIVQQEQIRANDKAIHITYHIDDEELWVNADIQYIERIITNLLENAIRHSPSDSRILITARQENQQITVSVCDQGVGIADNELDKVCTPHYQASNSQSETPGGLGLAICQRILQRHQSRLEIDSTLGKGSVFAFSLTAA